MFTLYIYTHIQSHAHTHTQIHTHKVTCYYSYFSGCMSCSTSIALSVVLTFILTAVISVIISSLVTFLCTKSYYSKSQEPNIHVQSEPVEQVPMYEVVENIPSKPQTTNMSLTTNPAYGHVQH